jgi:hypothetical protein
MPPVTRWRWPRPRRRPDDRGAVATVVAVLLAGGVLLGFGALAIDVGFIYAEREELVTGSDAAALAVGRACANDRPECANEAAILALVSTYANANASDGLSNVVEVCGLLSGRLAPCTAMPANLARCLGAAPTDATEFVEVRLSTLLDGGRLALPPVFAQTLVGNEDFEGATVRACARVSWERINVLGLTVSTCERAGAPTPSGPPYGPAAEHTVNFQTGAQGRCGPGIPGHWDSASHAGYLDANGQCFTDVPDDGEMWGNEPPDVGRYAPPCGRAALDALIASGEPVWVPVHDAHRHVGSRTAYRVTSVAKFVLTGYYFGNDPDEQKHSVLTGALPCQSSPGQPHSCISGVFVGPSQPLHTIAAGAIVRLIG